MTLKTLSHVKLTQFFQKKDDKNSLGELFNHEKLRFLPSKHGKMPKMAILTWFRKIKFSTLLAELLKMTAKLWSTTSYK